MAGCIFTCFKSPIISANRIVNDHERIFFRKKAIQLCLINYVIYILLSYTRVNQVAICLAIAQILIAVSMCIPKNTSM